VPGLPVSKKQLDKLGDRLRDSQEPAPADLDLLEEVLAAYDEALQEVTAMLRDRGFRPTSRVKTTGTIVEKLRRERSSSLKTIQDLAGARVVLDADLDEQDALVRDFCEHLGTLGCTHQVIDRRASPRSGYRAVHVVAKVADGLPVEVQFRTEPQDMWAQFFERLADAWGRQIRYGGGPDPHPRGEEMTELKRHIVEEIVGVSAQIDDLERAVVDAKIKFYQAPGTQHVDLNGSDGDVPADLQALRSNYRQAVEMRRRATEVIRTAFARMADLAEREG
jgi:ppGpp synthetase/RelA/SpoT-type nucleotidyltranferase